MNTNQGFNALAVLIPITTVATQMPDGTGKWVLLTVLSIAATVVGIATRGYQPPQDIEKDDSLETIVKNDREAG
jgi:hypothetical protein